MITEIRVLKVSGIDDFGSEPPFVRITSFSTGEIVNSAIPRRIKGPANKFLFDEEEPSNLLSFYVPNGEHAEFLVNLFSHDDSTKQLICYPGVGRFTIDIDTEIPSMEQMTCTLCEDGDADIEVGQVAFEFKVFSSQQSNQEPTLSATVTPSPHGNDDPEENEEAMERMMSSSGFHPSDLDGLGDDIFDSKNHNNNLNATTGHIERSSSPPLKQHGKKNTKSLSATAPLSKAVPSKKSLKAARTLDYSPEKGSPTKPPLSSSGTLASAKSIASNMLAVLKEPNTNANQPVYDLIKTDLSKKEDESLYRKITVKIHSVTLCADSSTGTTEEASANNSKKATLNISIAPLPNKATTFRSVQSNSFVSRGRAVTNYLFGYKTAALVMSVGDSRSKTFKAGQVPRLTFEVTSGDAVYFAETSLYLPALLRHHAGERITVSLHDSSGNGQLQGSCIVFELNTVSVASNSVDSTFKYRASYGCCNVSLQVLGVTGTDLKAFPEFKAQASLTSTLCCSSNTNGGAAGVFFEGSTGFNNTLYTLNQSFQLLSQWPAVELIELKLAVGSFVDDELGRVYIPVSSLLELSQKNPEYYQVPLAFNAYKREGDSFVVCKWQVICIASCSDVVEASEVITDSSAAPVNNSTNEIEDGFQTVDMTAAASSNRGMMIETSTTSSSPAPQLNVANGWLNTAGSATSAVPNRTIASVSGLVNTSLHVAPAKSVSGQLLCYCGGMFIRRTDPNSNTSNSSALQVLNNDHILTVEATLLPETKVKLSGSAPVVLNIISSSDIGSSVDWSTDCKGNKTIVFDVAWALQQRQVSCIRLNILQSSKKNPTQGIIGTAVIDLTSIIVAYNANSNSLKTSSQTCLVPVRSCHPHIGGSVGYGQDMCKSVLEDSDVAGWIVVSLQFNPAAAAAAPALSSSSLASVVSQLESRTKETFTKFKGYPSQYFFGLCGSDLKLLSGVNCVTPVAIQSNSACKVESVNVHIALSALVISSSASLLVDNNPNSVLYLYLKCANNLNSRLDVADPVISTASLINNTLTWSNSDVVVTLAVEDSLNSFLYFYLITREQYHASTTNGTDVYESRSGVNHFSSTMLTTVNSSEGGRRSGPLMTNNTTNTQRTSTVLAECNLLLYNATLKKGVPSNYTLPFRDREGIRLATLALGIQLTATGGCVVPSGNGDTVEDIYGRTNSPQFDLSSNIYMNTMNSMETLAAMADKGKLHLDFIEGNILDSGVWKSNTQPFFECSVVHTANANRMNSNDNNLGLSQARTNYFCLSSSGDSETSENLLQSLKTQNATTDWGVSCELPLPIEDYSVRTDGTKNIGGYTLHIVCRDSSRVSSPVIGTARIAIPVAMISKGAPVEQFITLTPPSSTVSAAVVGVRTAYSRVRIRITPISSVEPANIEESSVSGTGMGAVFYRLLGISESTSDGSGTLDAIVTGHMSCHALKPDELSSDEKNQDTLYSSSTAATTVYNNEWKLFDDNRILGGHIVIPGGFCELSLNVRPFTSTIPLTTAFPALSTLTKLPSAPVNVGETVTLPPTPMFELSLTKAMTGKTTSGHKAVTSQANTTRAVPRLMMEAVFVPYVVGKLSIECTDIKLFDSNSLLGTDNTQRNIVLRYVVSNAKHSFNYSPVTSVGGGSGLNGGRGSGAASVRSGVRGLKKNDRNNNKSDGFKPSITYLSVDTSDILGHYDSTTGQGMTSMLPLFVHAYEVDPPVTNGVSAEVSTQPCIGIGFISTAALYYQAMRVAASSSLHATSSELTTGSKGDSISIGESPVLNANVRLYHPDTKVSCGNVELKLKFIAESIPSNVVQQISQALIHSDVNSGGTDKARIELGLKQSFLVADEDKSGSVSASELLKVIKNADVRKTKRPLLGTSVVGMENAMSLLMSLVPQHYKTDNLEGMTDNDLVELVSNIFNKLDVDGDGLVSWWEWKAVLTAAMCSTVPKSIYEVNPMDTIVIGVTAANDALQAAQHGKRSSSTQGLYPFYPISGAAVQANSHVYTNSNPNSTGITVSNPFSAPTQDLLLDNVGIAMPYGDESSPSDSRTVAKLHNTIKSLRMTNNILAKRFEKAIITAQKMSINLDTYTQANGRTGAPEITAQDVIRLEERIKEAENENNSNLQAFLNAKNRGDILASQLLEMKSSTDFSTMANMNSINKNLESNKKLKSEIQSHADKLALARKQRKAMMAATVTIHQWLKKVVIPFLVRRRIGRQTAVLKHRLTSHVIKRNYKMKKQAEFKVINMIQRCVRGMLARKRVRKLNEDALKLQKAYRGKQDRDKVREIKRRIAEQKAAEAFSAKYRAVGVIKRALLRWLLFQHNRKEAAARKIQEAALKRKERKDMQARRDAERKKRDEEKRRQEESLKQNRAAITIQLANRDRLNRKGGKQMTAAQRIIRKFKSDRAAMVLTDKKPETLEHSVDHFWVDFTLTDSPSRKESSPVLNASTSVDKNVHIGRVEAVHGVDRIMTVKYLIPCTPSPASQNLTERFINKSIPFDHPQIKWYTTYVELPPEPEPTHYHNRLILNKVVKSEVLNRPAYIEAAVGYRVEIPSKEDFSEPGDMFTGKVIRVNPEKGLITVGFETVIPHTEDLDEFEFTAKDIVWVVKPPVERPDFLESCLGFGVEVMSNDDDKIEGDYFVGTIVAIDAAEQNVTISFKLNPPEGQEALSSVVASDTRKSLLRINTELSNEELQPFQQEPDLHTLNWLDTSINWVVAPIFECPKTIHETLGYRVEIKSREEKANIGDCYLGKVVGYHYPHQKIIVQFDSEADVEDREELPYKSPDVTWTAPPLSHPVVLRRPLTIEDTVGYVVEVKSSEPDAEPGDMFTGRVISFSKVRETVTIKFDTYTDDDPDDIEEFPFVSEAICWLHNPKQSRSKWRPPIEDTLRHVVEVVQLDEHSPAIVGEVVAFNAKTRALSIKFDEDLTETIHYTSSELIWRCPIVMIHPKSGGRVAVKSHTPKNVVSPRGGKSTAAATPSTAVVAAVKQSKATTTPAAAALVSATPKKSNLVDPNNKVFTPGKKGIMFSTAPDSEFIIRNDSSRSSVQLSPTKTEKCVLKLTVSKIDVEDVVWSSGGSLHPAVSFRFGTKEVKTKRQQQSSNGLLAFHDVLELEIDPDEYENCLELIVKVVILTPNDTVSSIVATAQRSLNALLPQLDKDKTVTLDLKHTDKLHAKMGLLTFSGVVEKSLSASASFSAKNNAPLAVAAAVASSASVASSSGKSALTSPSKELSKVNSSSSLKLDGSVDRPPLQEVKGYHIIVTEKDNADLHCKVVGYNETENQMLTQFYDVNGDLDPEIEELPYNMPGVRWFMSRPSWSGHK